MKMKLKLNILRFQTAIPDKTTVSTLHCQFRIFSGGREEKKILMKFTLSETRSMWEDNRSSVGIVLLANDF